eukprot:scaffold1634_cov118-Skeletonema_dohrnii-CCMP3373.AAC.6
MDKLGSETPNPPMEPAKFFPFSPEESILVSPKPVEESSFEQLRSQKESRLQSIIALLEQKDDLSSTDSKIVEINDKLREHHKYLAEIEVELVKRPPMIPLPLPPGKEVIDLSSTSIERWTNEDMRATTTMELNDALTAVQLRIEELTCESEDPRAVRSQLYRSSTTTGECAAAVKDPELMKLLLRLKALKNDIGRELTRRQGELDTAGADLHLPSTKPAVVKSVTFATDEAATLSTADLTADLMASFDAESFKIEEVSVMTGDDDEMLSAPAPNTQVEARPCLSETLADDAALYSQHAAQHGALAPAPNTQVHAKPWSKKFETMYFSKQQEISERSLAVAEEHFELGKDTHSMMSRVEGKLDYFIAVKELEKELEQENSGSFNRTKKKGLSVSTSSNILRSSNSSGIKPIVPRSTVVKNKTKLTVPEGPACLERTKKKDHEKAKTKSKSKTKEMPRSFRF